MLPLIIRTQEVLQRLLILCTRGGSSVAIRVAYVGGGAGFVSGQQDRGPKTGTYGQFKDAEFD